MCAMRGKWFVGCLLALIVTIVMTTNVRAKNNEGSGKCGDNVTWTLDNSGLLTISGQGEMYDGKGGWEKYDVYRVVVEEGVTRVGKDSFNIGTIKSVTLPETLESIGDSAFSWTVITSITLPDGLKTIGSSAFRSTQLKEVTIPDSVTSIGNRMFMDCYSLEKVTLSENISAIPEWCFHGCVKLSEINVPSSVQVIRSEAFRGCSALKNIDFPEGLETIEYYAFANTGLESIIFPSTLKTIGEDAFNSTKARHVTIPETVMNYGSGIFSFAQLTSATLPNNLKSIPAGLFDYSALTKLYIPEGVETIERNAFRGCQMSALFIPLSLTRIEDNAFWGVGQSVKDIFYAGTKEEWELIGIGANNYTIRDSKIHYNCVGGLLNPAAAKPIVFHVGMADEGKQDLEMTIPWDEELFMLDSQTFHNELAIPCLALSGAVELSGSRAADMLESFGFDRQLQREGYFNTEYNYLKPAAAFAYKQIELEGEKRNLFVIVVRGTTNNSDLLTDLSGAVGGFGMAAGDVKERFIEYVQDMLGYSYEEAIARSGENILLVTGHSLGGAVANHLSVDLLGFAPKEKSFIYTFAAPQSFPLVDQTYMRSMTNVFNVVNFRDKVPFLPPVGYYRIGNNRLFTSDAGKVQDYFKRLTSGKSYQEAYAGDWGWLFVPHAIETYMAYLMMMDGGTILDEHPVKVVSVECPGDVEVFDENGVLVGRIRDNQIDGSVSTEVALYVDGDKKYIVLMEDKKYSFVLTGTDDGVMNYGMSIVDTDNGERQEIASFRGVELKAGKKMACDVPVSTGEPIQLFAVNESGEPIAEITSSGKEISLIETEEPREEVEETTEPSQVIEKKPDEAVKTVSEDEDGSRKSSLGEKLRAGIENMARAFKIFLAVIIAILLLIFIIIVVSVSKRKKK